MGAGSAFLSRLSLLIPLAVVCLLNPQALWAQTDAPAETRASCDTEQLAEQSLGAPYSQYAGKTIAAVRVRQVYVFDENDPKENNRFYRLLNRLHIHTRPNVIRSQLLFDSGEALVPRDVAESERILRAKPYLSDARIVVDEVCGDKVALLVTTRDVWTTEPQITLGVQGGESNQGFALSEANVAGTGNAFSIGYSKDQDREAWQYDFFSPHLMNTRLNLHLGMADTSDGQQHVFSLEQPFYSLQTRWAAGIQNTKTTLEETVRFHGEELSAYRHTREYHEIFGGYALRINSEASQRLLTGITQERHDYGRTEETEGVLPYDYNIVYPWVEYQYIENKFAVYTNIDQMHRTEDVAIGSNWTLRLGFGDSVWGNAEDVLRLDGHYTDLVQLSDRQLLRMRLNFETRAYPSEEDLNESLWGAEFGYYHLQGDKHRWFVSLRLDQGDNLQPHNELTGTDIYGLRGYPVDYQRGDKRYLLTLEKRYISDFHLFNLVRVGSVIYFDAGRIWGAGYSDANHLSNVGLGLRLSSSKARVGKVVHLDLAYPLADKNRVDSYQWVITAANRF